MSGRRATVLVVTNIPTPYRLPLFEELARQLNGKGYRLKVVFGALGYTRRKWKIDLDSCRFEHEVLPSRTFYFRRSEGASFTYPSLHKVLRVERPIVVIVAGFSLATLKLWLKSFYDSTPYLIWSGAIQNKRRPVSPIRRFIRRAMVARASGFVAYGSMATAYLVSLGADPSRISIAINTVDTDFFRAASLRLADTRRRDEILYVGNLTAGKQIDSLIRAFAELATSRPSLTLTLVGDGPVREQLEALAEELGVSEHITFEGFRQRDEIPSYLARARCFAFPSDYDIWGLVLVEAMVSGVPCVASIRSGATLDLIREGETGFKVDVSNFEQLVSRLAELIDDPGFALRMGEAGRRFIKQEITIPKSAAGMVEAVRAVAGSFRRN